MCEFGRVVHHLVAAIENRKNTVLIVGFQAQHTLGRRLVEQRPRVRIFGVERERHAEVAVLNGFSAHAGQDDLSSTPRPFARRDRFGTSRLVHGEDQARHTLKALLEERGFPSVPDAGAAAIDSTCEVRDLDLERGLTASSSHA